MSLSPSNAPLAYSYVRLSTAVQAGGDGLRRQHTEFTNFAAAHGLKIASDAVYADIGISAFKGANVINGQLAAFIAAVHQGKVARGS